MSEYETVIERLEGMIPNGDGYNASYFDPVHKAVEAIKELELNNEHLRTARGEYKERIAELEEDLEDHTAVLQHRIDELKEENINTLRDLSIAIEEAEGLREELVTLKAAGIKYLKAQSALKGEGDG